MLKRGALYGVWLAVTLAIPGGVGISSRQPIEIAIAVVLVVIHFACIPLWLRSQRRFLANTEWSREQGIKPDELTLFNWRRKQDCTV